MQEMNTPAIYDHVRKAYRNADGSLPRYVRIEPEDRSRLTEPRQVLAISGTLRVGYDPRTHRLATKDNEVIIEPLPRRK
jgi:hypothetical protein